MSGTLRLLIIGDNTADGNVLEGLLAGLSPESREMRRAGGLAEALRVMQEHPPDVVLIDLDLPGDQGLKSITRIHAESPDVPIVAATGHDDERKAAAAIQNGAEDCLVKGQLDANLLVRSIRYARERKRVQRELQAADQRYRTIFDHSAAAIMMADCHERLVSWNRFAEQLLGMEPADLLGRSIASLHPESEWKRIRGVSLREKETPCQLETKMIRKDGRTIDVEVSLSLVRDAGGVVTGSICIVSDITQRRRAEEALRRHVHDVERFNRLATAREGRVIELKKRVNELLHAAGQSPPYDLTEDRTPLEIVADDPAADAPDFPAPGERDRMFRIEELFDRHQVQRLLESYCDATGVSSAIIDPQGGIFVGARWQRICTDFHRVHPETCARCVESDTVLAGQLQEGESFSCYQCRNGLTDAASPIVIEGRHVANVFIGQFLLEPPDRERFGARARQFGFDETAYLEALEHVPIVSREKLHAMFKYLTTCARLLAEVGLERLRTRAYEADLLCQAEELSQANREMCRQREAALSLAEDANEAREAAERAQQSLQKSEEHLRTVIAAVRDGIVMMGPDGEVSLWSPGAEAIFGWKAEDVLGKPVHPLLAPQRFLEAHARGFAEFQATGHGPAVGTTLELEARHKDGHEFPVELSLSAIRQADRWCAVGVIRDITERKRVEDALLVKDSAINSATSGIAFIDIEGRLTFVNPSCMSMWGYDHERDVLGRPFTSFLESEAEGLTLYRATLEAGAASGELTARRKDGSTFIGQVSANVVKDKHGKPLCLMASLIDVTESRRMHEILDWKQKNLSAIFDAAPAGMLLVNERRRVVRANDAVREISGKGYQEILHQNPCQALGCTRAPRAAESCRESAACETCLLEQLVEATFDSGTPVHGAETRPTLSRNGQEVRPWLAVSVEPVDIDGGRHVVIALNDITDRKEAEEQLRETMEMKSQFISTVSHELRTPLTAMKEAVTIVADGVAGKLSKDQRHFLEIARRNIDRLARLIDNVLDFQKLSAGKMRLDLQSNRMDRTLEEAYGTMLPHAQQKRLHMSLDLEPDLPAVAYDNDRMIQVLTNLLSNAIKFTPEEGRISVCARRRDDCLAVSVRDTGLGIPRDALPRIFSRFHRVHRPGKEIKGTGLGLAIVDKIVAAHGGRIEVESEVDKGTTFTVLLPLHSRQPDRDLARQVDERLESALADDRKT